MFHKRFILLFLLVSAFIQPIGVIAWAADISFTPGITLYEEYNDNILFSRTNKLEDFITRITPNFVFNVGSEQTDIYLSSSLTSETFVHNSKLNTLKTNNSLSIKREWDPRNLSVFNVTLVKDVTLETELQQAGLVARRTDRYRYGMDFSHTYFVNEVFSLYGEASITKTHYPDNYYPDRVLWRLNLTPSIKLSSKDSLGMLINYYYVTYENDASIKNFASDLYWSRNLSNSLKMTVGGGYRITWNNFYETYYFYQWDPILQQLVLIPVRQERRERDTGFLFKFRLEKNWTQRLSTMISAARELYNTTTATSSVVNYIQGSMHYRLNDTITSSLFVRYNKTKEETSTGRITNYIKIGPALTWRLSRDFSLSFGGDYEYFKDETAEYHKDRYKCWIRLTYSYPRLFATN